MESAGHILKTEREAQKKTLDSLAENLKINIDYLRAIENDNYDLIPAEVFTRAYISLYAEALGLDNNAVLESYDGQDRLSAEENKKSLARKFNFNRSLAPIIEGKHFKPALIMISLTVLLVASFSLFGNSDEDIHERTAVKTQPVTDVNRKNVAGNESESLTLKITAAELTWVSISIDGQAPREWLLKTGEEMNLTASEVFALKIGNAGGTRLTLNDEDIGELGPPGKVVDIVLPEGHDLP